MGLVSPDFNGDVYNVSFVSATPAEAAKVNEVAKVAESAESDEAAKVAESAESDEAAKVAEAAKAAESNETDNNPWGRHEPPTEAELDKAKKELLDMLVARGFCPPGTSVDEVDKVKFISVETKI